MNPSSEDDRQDNLLVVAMKNFGEMKWKKILFISLLGVSLTILNVSRVVRSRQPDLQEKAVLKALEVAPTEWKAVPGPTSSTEGPRSFEQGPTVIATEAVHTTLKEDTTATKVIPTMIAKLIARKAVQKEAETKHLTKQSPEEETGTAKDRRIAERLAKQKATEEARTTMEKRIAERVAKQNAAARVTRIAERLAKQKAAEEARTVKEKRVAERLMNQMPEEEASIAMEKWIAGRVDKQNDAARVKRIAERLAKQKAMEGAGILREKRVAEGLAKQETAEEVRIVEEKQLAVQKSEAERLTRAKAVVERLTKLKERELTSRSAEEKRAAVPVSKALKLESNSDQYKEVYVDDKTTMME